jgi:hypothetical protein
MARPISPAPPVIATCLSWKLITDSDFGLEIEYL